MLIYQKLITIIVDGQVVKAILMLLCILCSNIAVRFGRLIYYKVCKHKLNKSIYFERGGPIKTIKTMNTIKLTVIKIISKIK
jgi:hypothetical protein